MGRRRRPPPRRPPVLPGPLLAPGGTVRHGRGPRRPRHQPADRRHRPALHGARLLPRRRRLRLLPLRRRRHGRTRRPRPARLARRRPRGGSIGPGRRGVQPHRRPAARRVPRHRHPRADLHRAARALQRTRPHRRLQRPRGPPAQPLRPHLRRHRTPRRPGAVRRRREALVPRSDPAPRRGALRQGSPQGPPGTRHERHPGPPDRRRSHGHPRGPLPRRRLRPVLHVRGSGGRPARPGLPAHRAGVLRHGALPRIPGHDRHRRSRLGRRRGGRRRLRLPPAAAPHPLQRRAAPGLRPGDGRDRPGEASRYLYGAAVVAVVLFLPGGLVRLAAGKPKSPPPADPTSTSTQPSSTEPSGETR